MLPILGVQYFRNCVDFGLKSVLIIFIQQVAIVADICGYLLLYLLDQIKFILLTQIVEENQLFVFVSLTKFWQWVEIYGIFK
jgi:hypothetical protein